jgi:hypothetical protein
MKNALSYVVAVAVGLGLFAMPFLLYGLGGGHAHGAGPHADHGARHGGQLVMVNDYHLELVEQPDSVELYLSDAFRRPLRPASCAVAFDDSSPTACEWRRYRSVVPRPNSAQSGLYEVHVDDGSLVTLKFRYASGHGR